MAPPPAPAPMARAGDLIPWEARLRAAIEGVGLSTLFQPIVDVRRGTVVGYEALSRFAWPDPGPTPPPDVWFRAAAVHGLLAELDAAALRSALAHRPRLPANCFLSVNVEPEVLATDPVRSALSSAGDLGGLVVELTEHRPWDPRELRPAIDWLRGEGAFLAVDDAGAGYSGLQIILDLRPSLLKLDRSLVIGVDGDEAKAAIVEMVGHFASRIDAWVLAEGVETADEATRIADLGVPLVQGYLFGHPAPPWAGLDTGAEGVLPAASSPDPGTLAGLVVPAPSVTRRDALAEVLGGSADWVVVVDDGGRPVGLATPRAAVAGGLLTTLRVGFHTSPEEVAHRLSTSEHDPSLPAVVTDSAGRYLGVVPLRRLLAHLGAEDPGGR